jgi:hypothetical protein
VHLPAPAPKEPMQGVRGREHLPAPAPKKHMQGVRGGGHLPAPARKEAMQGVRGVGICPHQRRRIRCKECREEADTSMPAGLEELAGPAHAAGKDL